MFEIQPIYKEFIDFLEQQTGTSLGIKEGYCWLDNHAIIGIDINGNKHILYRYSVSDDLSITIKTVKKKYPELESWDSTVKRYDDRLIEIESKSIEFVRYTLERELYQYEPYILTSTGKDSVVMTDIVHKVRPSIPVVFNNTSLESVETYKIVKSHSDWIVTNPEEGFYQWVNRKHYIPTRFSRVCCTQFKEGNHIEYFTGKVKRALWFMGVRNDESVGRRDREDYTFNPRWYDRDWCGALPIRTWSEFDVWLYILKYNLEINPRYKYGYTRCSCLIGCPFTTKYTWILDKYWYPKMFDRWHKILDDDFIQNERWYKMNCTQDEYHRCWSGGFLRPEPTDEVVQEFMNYKSIKDIKTAKQYFNKKCFVCNKNVIETNLSAMNLKFLGKDTDIFYCKNHLKEKMNINEEQYNSLVDDYKSQGCILF